MRVCAYYALLEFGYIFTPGKYSPDGYATDLFLLGLDVHRAGSETPASIGLLSSASVAHPGLEASGSLCLGLEITERDYDILAMSDQAYPTTG